MGAAVAQWIRLRLPSCRPGFESQAHHLSFYQFIFELYHVEKDENKQKEAGIGPFLNNIASRHCVGSGAVWAYHPAAPCS